VSVPELPKQEPSWTLSKYAFFIEQEIAQTRPRVIVAHSFSGVFLPLLSSHADLLIFEAAVVPEPGRSVYDQYLADDSMFSAAWIAAGSRWFNPAERPDLAREFLFHDCEPARFHSALATVELFDTRHLVKEPSPMAFWPSASCVSVVCSEDRTLRPDWSRMVAVSRLAIRPIEIMSGHCPHSSRPREIATILQTLVG
jgi:hypothetical protein